MKLDRTLSEVEFRVLTYLGLRKGKATTVGQVAANVPGAGGKAGEVLESLRDLRVVSKIDAEHFWSFVIHERGVAYLKGKTSNGAKKRKKALPPTPLLHERLQTILDESIAGIEHPSQVAINVCVPRADLQEAVRGLKAREVSTGLPEDFLAGWDDLRRAITAIETATLHSIGEATRWLEEERQKFDTLVRDTARNA
ncbi:hypothetical protein D869_gp126 [Caulobacter phage CcrRogue]|uniref:Uncharacterized protein n=1 Tax=Caulobacter phage CcrRogue TaxID=2927986 RepID=K4JSQ7_9CAUD|nr:hypothetical protein D869_gp126 [Caulobacter phage CcrRogue]AFU86788.1 hypothetical protein CcrRogue_gp306 [Caulobacter phage CcrRogue]